MQAQFSHPKAIELVMAQISFKKQVLLPKRCVYKNISTTNSSSIVYFRICEKFKTVVIYFRYQDH